MPCRAQKDSIVFRQSARRWPYSRMASLFRVTEMVAPLSRSISRTSPPRVGRSSCGDSTCNTITSPERAESRLSAFSQVGERRRDSPRVTQFGRLAPIHAATGIQHEVHVQHFFLFVQPHE